MDKLCKGPNIIQLNPCFCHAHADTMGMHQLPRFYSLLFLVIILGGTLHCSNLLYYPDHVMYIEEDLMEFKPEDVLLKIPSNDVVHGWYFTAKVQPKGVIVFFHGNGQNRSSHITEVYWLLKAGYNLFVPEYPGYGETEGTPTPQNTVQTGHAALRYVAQRNPNLPMIVYGQSLGGAVALRSVLDLKSEIKFCLFIADSTFLSYRRVGQKILSKTWFTWPFQMLAKILLNDEFAPGDQITKFPAPLLVIHDQKDPVVPFSFGEEIFLKSPEPKDIWRLNESKHGQPFSGAQGLTNRKRFLNKLSTVILLNEAKP
ncbi:MAG: alpha/beta hydrolase [Bdellovibrionales bacterium]|nr:alpha/beta hydrolase [Bdellovibrionales bacterium]